MTDNGDEFILKTQQVVNSTLPQISVVVCTYNREKLLNEALHSLEQQTLNPSLFEVLIINNNSTDGTQKLAEKFAARHMHFRVIIEKEQGLSHARNRGWKEAKGKYVAYMDDDAKAISDWCEKILHAFETVRPQPIAVGGKILPWYEVDPPDWFSDELEIRSWGEEAKFLHPPWGNLGFSGSNMAFQKNILAKYEGFSVKHGMIGGKMRYGEETDLFVRIEKDEKIYWYDPCLIIFHFTPQKNMKVFYYLKRAYISGKTASIIGRKNFFAATRSAKLFYEIIVFLLSSPRILIEAKNFKKVFVVRSKQLASLLGLFVGSLLCCNWIKIDS